MSGEPVASVGLSLVEHGRDPAQRLGRTVVVGYNGSRAAWAAVLEAARRAGEHGQVFVVYAHPRPPKYLGVPYFGRRLTDTQGQGRTVLNELLGDRLGELPVTHYVPELIGGAPADAINDVACVRDADEIVIGSSGARRLSVPLLGVSHRLLRIADRPVVVVPARSSPSG
ncbi:MAG: universal stress protein [Solirubrobacteraceae bacterium]